MYTKMPNEALLQLCFGNMRIRTTGAVRFVRDHTDTRVSHATFSIQSFDQPFDHAPKDKGATMNPGFHQATLANNGRTASPEAPREYRNAFAGRKDDFIVSLGQLDWVKKEDRVTTSTILLAEDNDDLRYVLETYLEMIGYGVVPCCDGQVASAMFLSNTRIDALISDLEMPGKSGLELARELTLIRPTLPVLIVSGSQISSDMAFEMESRNGNFYPSLVDFH
jgi:CheY-like chemotaxis protein